MDRLQRLRSDFDQRLDSIAPDNPLVIISQSLHSYWANSRAFKAVGIFPKREALPRHFAYMRHDRTFLMPQRPKNGNDGFRILGVKHWYDGSPYTGSMYIDSPYIVSPLTVEGFHISPGHRGKALVSQSDLLSFLTTYHEQGWQIQMEDKLGSIKVGKYADLIILNSNPLEIPIEQLEHIEIEACFIAGNRVEN